jgi:AcrR family transcriptional regulator
LTLLYLRTAFANYAITMDQLPSPAVPIWLRPEREGAGRPARRSRSEIASAAIAVADAEGIESVSMRRVAARLGTGAASLYRYVDTRADLLDLMTDAVGAEYDLAAPGGDWLADLVAVGVQARRIMLRHPWLPGLLLTRAPLGPHGLALLEHVLAVLADHPAGPAAKLEAFGLLTALTAVFVQAETAADAGVRQRNAAFLQHAVASGEYPELARSLAAADPVPADPGARFPQLLGRVLTGLLGPG